MTTLVSDAPIPAGSAASGFEHVVGLLLAQFSDTALELQPQRAAVHALGAWGRFLIEPDNPAVQSGMQLAAELAAEDRRYAELAKALEARAVRLRPRLPPPPFPVYRRFRTGWPANMDRSGIRRAVWLCGNLNRQARRPCLPPLLSGSRRRVSPPRTLSQSMRPGRAAGWSWDAWSSTVSTTSTKTP